MTEEERRWDEDENLEGVASAKMFASDVDRLRDLMGEEKWVAEDPHLHLYPHILRAVDDVKSLEIIRAEDIPHGIYEVKLRWEPSDTDAEKLVSQIYSIIGSFAEFSTSVIQKVVEDEIHFEVTTGMPPEVTPFRTHGHTIRLRVTGESAADAAANHRAFREKPVEESSTSSTAPEGDAAERAGPS